jgi:hypothetical protein
VEVGKGAVTFLNINKITASAQLENTLSILNSGVDGQLRKALTHFPLKFHFVGESLCAIGVHQLYRI